MFEVCNIFVLLTVMSHKCSPVKTYLQKSQAGFDLCRELGLLIIKVGCLLANHCGKLVAEHFPGTPGERLHDSIASSPCSKVIHSAACDSKMPHGYACPLLLSGLPDSAHSMVTAAGLHSSVEHGAVIEARPKSGLSGTLTCMKSLARAHNLCDRLCDHEVSVAILQLLIDQHCLGL